MIDIAFTRPIVTSLSLVVECLSIGAEIRLVRLGKVQRWN